MEKLPLHRFTLVDALRGAAALNVVLFHAIGGGHIPALFEAMPPWLRAFLQHGDVGVAIFFVLSGFVIAHSLRSDRLTVADVGRFMLRRSIRLDPPYWVAIALTMSFSIVAAAMVKGRAADQFTVGQVMAHVVYLQEILQINEISPVFWTLCLEIQFYLVFAILLLTRSRLVLLAAFGVSLLWPLGLSAIPAGLFVGLWYGFLLGAGAYFSWQDQSARPWFYLYVTILVCALTYHGDAFGLTCCTTALLLHAAARTKRIGTALNWRWIQFLGTISYSLYLIHNPITGAVFRVGFILTGDSTLTELLWWIVSIGASIVAASVFYFLIERPSIALSKLVSRFTPHGLIPSADYRSRPERRHVPSGSSL